MDKRNSSVFFTLTSLAIPISAASWCSTEIVAHASDMTVVVISLSCASRAILDTARSVATPATMISPIHFSLRYDSRFVW